MNSCVCVQGLFVDDRHKVLICTHAKAGSTTWKTILATNVIPLSQGYLKYATGVIQHSLHNFNIYKLNDRSKFSDDDIRLRLQTYYKVMIVRHPYDR